MFSLTNARPFGVVILFSGSIFTLQNIVFKYIYVYRTYITIVILYKFKKIDSVLTQTILPVLARFKQTKNSY